MSRSPRIEAILERQARSWTLREELAKQGGEEARRSLAHLKEGPWVTVSRQIGSGGAEIAAELGRQLGWEVFDRAILTSIAQHTETRESVLSRVDERAIGRFRDFVSQLIVPDDPGRLGLVQQMSQVIWGIARQGSAVLIGRGANWILDPRFGLRVRLLAPFDVRVERVATREKIGPEEARRRTRSHDAQRAAFVREFFNREIDDPLGYDLILNTAGLAPRSGAILLRAALQAKLG